MIRVICFKGCEMEIKTATANGVIFVRHQDLQSLGEADAVAVDYYSLGADDTNAYAMCVAGCENIISFGVAVAPTMKQAVNLAYDDAIIGLYGLGGRSYDEYKLWMQLRLQG